MGLEYEKKFRASEAVLRKIDAALTEPPYALQMETTYYDTPQGDLSRRKITLRRRLENGVSVCTLKTPTGTAARGEFQVECDRITDAIPILCKLSNLEELLPLTGQGVVPVCGAKFTRTARKISFGDSLLEVALDTGILIGGDKELPLFEVEVELLSGEMGDADLYANLLSRRFSLQQEPKSKFRRALSLAKGEEKWQ
ncbi:MAG: CYTH domain-containing protein [Oscillospiraceae bacterium]|nr:CYTH domain-containing protein [Oscillospiraceae bacterium]